jgi:hypothetical protein
LWRTIHRTAVRTAAAVLRWLGRPRFFEIKPAAQSLRNAFNNRHTWRLNWTALTFARWAYRAMSHNERF